MSDLCRATEEKGAGSKELAQQGSEEMSGCVYRMYNECGDLLYVGVSLSAVGSIGRIRSHNGCKPWAHEIASIRLQHFPTPHEACEHECLAIRDERPRYNKINPLQPAKIERRPQFRKPLAKDAHKTLAATKPWETEGISRRTWYRERRRKEQGK